MLAGCTILWRVATLRLRWQELMKCYTVFSVVTVINNGMLRGAWQPWEKDTQECYETEHVQL